MLSSPELREQIAQLVEHHVDQLDYANKTADAILHLLDAARTESQSELLEALENTTVHLIAAVSLLRASPKTAAPSNKMFDQMVRDYEAAILVGRSAISRAEGLALSGGLKEGIAVSRTSPSSPSSGDPQAQRSDGKGEP